MHPRRIDPMKYPKARRDPLVERLHGMAVPDPYRWLEDVDSEETVAWTEAQNALARSVIDEIPFRGQIRSRLDSLSEVEAVGVPKEAGDRLFFTLRAPDARQASLVWQGSGDAEPHTLVDPEELSDDGTISVTEFAPSPCGKYIAYTKAEAGSDWQILRVIDVGTGEHLDDRLEWLKFPGVSWLPDSSGFFYAASEPPPPGDEFKASVTQRSLRLHHIGEEQSADELILKYPGQPQWLVYGEVTADGRYLIVSIFKGTYQENRVALIDLGSSERTVVDLMPNFDATYRFVGSEGDVLFFHTTREAPFGRIVAVNSASPAPENWRVVIPESDATIDQAVCVAGRLVVASLRDAVADLSVYSKQGKRLHQVGLPGAGTIEVLRGRERGQVAYFSYGDFVRPNLVYRLDVETGEPEAFRGDALPYDPDDYTTETHWVETEAGVRVPVFLTRKAGVEAGRKTPTCLYGYGGFNIPMSPHFKIDHLSWLDLGGQLAVACIRGGGEFGEDWHQAGAKTNRPNVFSDFIAVAEWLVETKRTSTPKLAIYGRSNGGLLVGACMTQRPELFGACLPTVGVLDMLRFHLFTVGSFWVSDYGSPDDKPEFEVLHSYSPVHNVVDGTAYPPTLVSTADHDDRVFPAHSHKFAAALQAAQASDAPILLRVDFRAGHGLGKPKGKLLDEVADRWAFAFAALDSEPRF